MKKNLLTLLIFIVSTSLFGQVPEQNIDNNKAKANLFEHFYHHQNLEITHILDNDIDFDFLKEIKYTEFILITENEIDELESYLLFEQVSMKENVGLIKYAIVRNGEARYKKVSFNLTNYSFLKQ